MFERYTEKARRTIFFSRYEASQYGSPYIEVPHLLLGLTRENFPTFQSVSGVEKEALQQAIEKSCGRPGQKIATSVDLPLSHAAKRVLSYGAEEAERMKHRHIGPEHLLLGVLLERGKDADLLAGFGIVLDKARQVFQGPTPQAAAGAEPRVTLEAIERLVGQLPEDRLPAAARILAGLSSGYFKVEGVSSEGPFSFSFGAAPPTA